MNSEIPVIAVAAIAVVVLAIAVHPSTFDVPEGFCGLLYRHGKSLHRISPGRHRFWSRGYSVRLVDMRKTTIEVSVQNALSSDHVSLEISAVLAYQIIQAETALHEVQDYSAHLTSSVQSAVCSLVASIPAENVPHRRPELGEKLRAVVEPEADRIGIIIHALRIDEVKMCHEQNNARTTTA